MTSAPESSRLSQSGEIREENASVVLDEAPCGFLTALPDGTITQVNQTFVTWSGHSRESLLSGTQFQALLTKPGQVFYQTHIAPLLFQQGFVKEIACELQREGLPLLPALVNFSVKSDASGRPLLIRISVFDATDRTRYEEELHSARVQAEQLAAIVTSSSDAIVSMDADSAVRTWNHGATRLFGYTLAEAAGRKIAELIVPDDLLEERKHIYEAVRFSHQSIVKETTRRRRDGSRVAVELTVSPMFDSEKNLSGMSAIYRDVSERKQAEAALRAGQQRIHLATEATGVGIWEWNLLTNTMRWDDVLFEMYGIVPTPDRLVQYSDWAGALLAEDLAENEAILQDTVRRCGRSVRSFRIRRRIDGEIRHIEAVEIVRANAHGEAEWVVGTNLDVTERKQFELQLQHAKSAAEKASLAKSEFLSRMSHELRTPLNAILGFAQLIETDTPPLTTAQQAKLEQILQGGWYLLDLINEILDLSLVESGKLALSLEPLALAEVVLECQAMILPQAEKRGVALSFPPFAASYWINADRTRMKQVLLNLLSNAIKYNRTGGKVEFACREIAPRRIRISVTDTGEGMSPQQLSQLFEPFNRLGREVMAEEGTGIGLVLSKRLVESMGGVIGVQSSVGKGSVFWSEFDLTDAPSLNANATPPSHTVGADDATDAPPARTVLCVEDNPANLMMIEDIIARWPSILRLLSASDGVRGVELARAARPDVILMDINLPRLSGIEALQILRQDPATARIPVVAISANAMPHDVRNGLAAGFFRYITKPIKINELIETLATALKIAEGRDVHAPKTPQGD